MVYKLIQVIIQSYEFSSSQKMPPLSDLELTLDIGPILDVTSLSLPQKSYKSCSQKAQTILN